MNWLSLSLVILVLSAACSTSSQAPMAAPVVERPTPPPVGSSWIVSQKNSGSFGKAAEPLTIRRLADETYQGRVVRAYQEGPLKLYVDEKTGGWIARFHGTTMIESFDPPLGWEFPISVGKFWLARFRYTNPRLADPIDVSATQRVEAYEAVNVPAGTFKTFKVIYDSQNLVVTSWWSPELQITVKSVSQRKSGSALGPGTREAELLSYDIKK